MMEPSDMSSSAVEEKQARICDLKNELREKQFMYDRLGLILRRCTFVNPDPDPSLDETKIMGTICSLIQSYDRRFSAPLEFTAGEKLYGVVVDSEETATTLMSKGNLLRQTMFVMLDTIGGKVISRDTLQVAQQLGDGPENVKLALDLITYDSKYESAMQWVFGDTLIVRDLDIAELLAFHPAVACRCITFDGDEILPCGARTGGPTEQEQSVFQMLDERKELFERLEKIKADIERLTAEKEQDEVTAATVSRV